MNYITTLFKKNALANNVVILFVMTIAGMLLSVFIKGENITDLINYHYYLGYRFFTGDTENHLALGGPNGFLNPILEVPIYLYITYLNDYPDIIYALQGIWYGVALFFLFKIITLFIEPKSVKNSLFILLCLILATTRQAIWIQIGTSTNEIPMLCLDLCGLYIILRTLKFPERQNFKDFILAGLIMGIALGLKMTSSHVCISAGIMLILCRNSLKISYKNICLFALAGFILINGFFMYKLWTLYGNPFFPFLNNIFKSEYAPPIPFRDNHLSFEFYYPLLPYFFYIIRNPMCTDRLMDYFFGFSYAVLIFYILLVIWKKYIKKTKPDENLINALAVFLILDWFIGMYMFGILRYFVVYCALTSFFVPYLFFKIYKKYNSKMALSCLFILLLYALLYNPFFYLGVVFRYNLKQYIAIEKINIPENALVKLYGNCTSFLVPFLAQNSTFKSVPYHQLCLSHNFCHFFGKGEDFVEKYKFREEREKIVNAHTGPVIYFFNTEYMDLLNEDYSKDNYDEEKELIERSHFLKMIKKERYVDLLRTIELKKMKLYKETVEDLKNNYYCCQIKTNIENRIDICVPKELKQQILKDDY